MDEPDEGAEKNGPKSRDHTHDNRQEREPHQAKPKGRRIFIPSQRRRRPLLGT